VIALVLGVAAALAGFASIRSAHLGAAARKTAQAQLAAREARLNRAERALRRALAAPAAAPAVQRRPPRVVYVRPAPIVIHKHRGGGGDGAEGGNDD
jgi:hypothetical protein